MHEKKLNKSKLSFNLRLITLKKNKQNTAKKKHCKTLPYRKIINYVNSQIFS